MKKKVIIMGAAGRDFHNFNAHFRGNPQLRDADFGAQSHHRRHALQRVIVGTPIDLRRVVRIDKKTVRVKYELNVLGPVCLEETMDNFLARRGHGE
ncbi:MAG: hypothetical protein ACE14S_10410 [Candidatus Bathyarchaeia archaeon]